MEVVKMFEVEDGALRVAVENVFIELYKKDSPIDRERAWRLVRLISDALMEIEEINEVLIEGGEKI